MYQKRSFVMKFIYFSSFSNVKFGNQSEIIKRRRQISEINWIFIVIYVIIIIEKNKSGVKCCKGGSIYAIGKEVAETRE